MKDDAISRQAAIDALNDEFTIIGKTNAIVVQDYIRRVNIRLHDLPSVQPEPYEELDCVQEHKKIPVVLDIQQKGKSMPSAQPDHSGDVTEMVDLIERQAAINAIKTSRFLVDAMEKVIKLPSAQPEVIHCEDCKYCQREDYDVWISKEVYDTRTSFWCSKLRDVDQKEQIEVMLDDYCAWAERRTDE